MSKLGLCTLVLFLMLVPVVASATTIVYDETTFLNGVASGVYLENFNGLSVGPLVPPANTFGGSGFTFTASAPSGVAITSVGGAQVLSNHGPDEIITFTFGPGVTALGGWFATTKNGVFNGGKITLTLSDGTVASPPNDPNNFVFTGFLSTTPITSLTVTNGNSGKKHLAVENLYVGSMLEPVPPVATPEPVSMGLAAAGFALVAFLRRRTA